LKNIQDSLIRTFCWVTLLILTMLLVALATACTSPYTRIEQTYYPERSKEGKRLPVAELAEIPGPKTEAELRRGMIRALHYQMAVLAQQQHDAAAMQAFAASMQQSAAHMQQGANPQASLSSFIQSSNTTFHLQQIDSNLSGINQQLPFQNMLSSS
jgi:hypothetical protein